MKKQSSVRLKKEASEQSFAWKQKSIGLSKEALSNGSEHIAAQTFTFRELAMATKNFRPDCLVGEGGFGRVYKGRIEGINQVSLFFTHCSACVVILVFM